MEISHMDVWNRWQLWLFIHRAPQKFSLIISLMKCLTWYSCVWPCWPLAVGRKMGILSPHSVQPSRATCQESQVTCPVELLLHFFFLVFFKVLIVGISAWCPWIVAFFLLPVVSYKHCLVAVAIFPGAVLPLLSRPSIFCDTRLSGRSYGSGGIRLVLASAWSRNLHIEPTLLSTHRLPQNVPNLRCVVCVWVGTVWEAAPPHPSAEGMIYEIILTFSFSCQAFHCAFCLWSWASSLCNNFQIPMYRHHEED